MVFHNDQHRDSRVQRIIPDDLNARSTVEDARYWITHSCPADQRPPNGAISHAELCALVKHLKEKKVPLEKLDVSDDPSVIAKALLKTADLDGDEVLDMQEFKMLWRLCVPVE